MQPYPTLTAETLLQDWESLARPVPTVAYPTARAAMHAALDSLLTRIDPDADVNIDPEDVRELLHRAGTFQSGTATASGPRRAEEAVDRALTNAMWLGPTIQEPPLRGILVLSSTPDAELEMDELTSAIDRLSDILRAPDLEIIFGCDKMPALPSGTLSVTLVLAYGPLLPASPLPRLTLSEYSDPVVAFETAARLVVARQVARTSLLQRRMKLGYNRAGRMLDEMDQAGVIGPCGEGRRHPVLVPDEQALALLLGRPLL